jgi:hypothetical protein
MLAHYYLRSRQFHEAAKLDVSVTEPTETDPAIVRLIFVYASILRLFLCLLEGKISLLLATLSALHTFLEQPENQGLDWSRLQIQLSDDHAMPFRWLSNAQLMILVYWISGVCTLATDVNLAASKKFFLEGAKLVEGIHIRIIT